MRIAEREFKNLIENSELFKKPVFVCWKSKCSFEEFMQFIEKTSTELLDNLYEDLKTGGYIDDQDILKTESLAKGVKLNKKFEDLEDKIIEILKTFDEVYQELQELKGNQTAYESLPLIPELQKLKKKHDLLSILSVVDILEIVG